MVKRLVGIGLAVAASAGVGLAAAPAATAYNAGTMIVQSAAVCRAEERRFRTEGYVITHGCLEFANGWAFSWHDPRP